MTPQNKKQEDIAHITEFYRAYNDKNKDMTTLEHGKPGIPVFIRLLCVLVIALCAAAAWVGYQYYATGNLPFFSFAKKDAYIDAGVSINETEVFANGLFTMRVYVKNTSAQPLEPVSVIIDYPEEYVFYGAAPVLPKNEKKNYWELGAITAGEKITLEVTGRMSAQQVLQEKNIRTTVYYKPVSLSAEFKSEIDTSVVISPVQFRLRIDGPREVEKGEYGTYTVAFHKSLSAIGALQASGRPPLEVLFEYPEVFTLKDTFPSPTKQGMRWNLSDLSQEASANDTVSISVRGLFQTEQSTAPLTAKIGYYIGEEFVVLDQTQYLPSLAMPFEKKLILSLTVDEKTSPLFLAPGELGQRMVIPLTLLYENTGKIALGNVSFILSIPKNALFRAIPDEWNIQKSEPVFPYTYIDTEENQIRITSAEVPALSEIGPSATGTISIFLRNMDSNEVQEFALQDSNEQKPLTISLSAYINTPQQRSLEGPQFVIKRVSDTSFRVNASTGVAISAMEWIIENSLHELENIRVSAILPVPLSWTERSFVSAGTLRYIPDTREVLWTVNRMPVSVKSLNARFDLEGALSQAGEPVVSTLTAKDKATGFILSIQKKSQ